MATMVPTPSSVKISRSRAWGTRPSRMWARVTPARRARAQASILGTIPSVAAPERQHGLELADGDRPEHGGRIVGVGPDAGDIGEEDELLGLEGGGHRPGHGVGVDVVGLTGGVGGDGGHHRDETLGQEAPDEGGVDAFDVAHETELAGPGHGRDQVGVLTGQTDGQRAVDVDGRDDLAVDLPDQNHPGDLEGLGVGHPHPVAELGRLAQPGHHRTDLGTAAVDDDREHPHRAHEDDVFGELGQGGGVGLGVVGPGVAAVLDHDDLVPETEDVGQGLDQDGRLGPGACRARRAVGRPERRHEVVLFSSM